jgi:hydrogenase expression/formation protein HypE
VNDTVRGVCELLGLDALNFANEGKLVIAVAREAAEAALAQLRPPAWPRCRDNRRRG